MPVPYVHTLAAGVVVLTMIIIPVSAASCGCSGSQVDRGLTIWDKGVQWSQVTPDTSTLAGTMATASQGLSQYKAMSGGTMGNTLMFKVSSVSFKPAGSRSMIFLPFKKAVK